LIFNDFAPFGHLVKSSFYAVKPVEKIVFITFGYGFTRLEAMCLGVLYTFKYYQRISLTAIVFVWECFCPRITRIMRIKEEEIGLISGLFF
jgi:hypothetical protein